MSCPREPAMYVVTEPVYGGPRRMAVVRDAADATQLVAMGFRFPRVVIRQSEQGDIRVDDIPSRDGVWLGDDINGYIRETHFDGEKIDEAAAWLHEQAVEAYPDSDYAKKARAS